MPNRVGVMSGGTPGEDQDIKHLYSRRRLWNTGRDSERNNLEGMQSRGHQRLEKHRLNGESICCNLGITQF